MPQCSISNNVFETIVLWKYDKQYIFLFYGIIFHCFSFSCCWGGKIAKNENCATLLDKCALSQKGASDARQFSPTLSLGLGGTFLNEEKMDENVYNNSWWCWLSYSSPASSIYTLILIDSQIMILYSSKSFKSNKIFLEFYTMSNRHILWIWWAFCFFLVHKSKPKSFTFF